MPRNTNDDNYPDDIRSYDHDPRSPFYTEPAMICSYCGESFDPEEMYEDDMCQQCAKELSE